MVNMLLASSSNTHMHQPTTQLPQYFRSQSDYFQTCFWECACKILHVIVLFLFLARIAAVTALDTFSVSLQEPILALLLYISRAKPYFTTSLSLSTRTSHHPDTQEWTNIAKRGLYTAHVYTSELPSLA